MNEGAYLSLKHTNFAHTYTLAYAESTHSIEPGVSSTVAGTDTPGVAERLRGVGHGGALRKPRCQIRQNACNATLSIRARSARLSMTGDTRGVRLAGGGALTWMTAPDADGFGLVRVSWMEFARYRTEKLSVYGLSTVFRGLVVSISMSTQVGTTRHQRSVLHQITLHRRSGWYTLELKTVGNKPLINTGKV